MQPESVKEKAVEDFRRGDPLKDIAIRYGVSEGSVSLWAKAAGLRRSRGCRPKLRPSRTDWEIVEAVRSVTNGHPTLKEIGEQFGGMSRAGVHRIYKKWRHWKPKMPFPKGSVIRYGKHDYEVVEPGLFAGLVRGIDTGRTREVEWVTTTTQAVLLKGRRRSKTLSYEEPVSNHRKMARRLE